MQNTIGNDADHVKLNFLGHKTPSQLSRTEYYKEFLKRPESEQMEWLSAAIQWLNNQPQAWQDEYLAIPWETRKTVTMIVAARLWDKNIAVWIGDLAVQRTHSNEVAFILRQA